MFERRFEIAIEIHKYASNQINSLKCNLVCNTNMTHKFMLRSRPVENRRETIINSAYCRFLCLISLHTACVNSYTFSAAQIQVISFDS